MTEFFNVVLAFFNTIIDFITDGIYDFFVDLVSYLIQKSTLATLKVMYVTLNFSWDIAQNIIADLQLSSFIGEMFSHFDIKIVDLLLWLRVPEFINTIGTAYMTRFVMRFIPFV